MTFLHARTLFLGSKKHDVMTCFLEFFIDLNFIVFPVVIRTIKILGLILLYLLDFLLNF